MKQSTQRPVFLNLLQIRLPLGGVLSIIHRVSGILLVVAIPALIYFLQLLNGGEESFAQAQALLLTVSGKIIFSLIARTTAIVAFSFSFILIVFTGALIWL